MLSVYRNAHTAKNNIFESQNGGNILDQIQKRDQIDGSK